MEKTRCAIYTRKSSEDGLEQEFNSLDAQRESCAAYVLSQKAEGWVLLEDHYDDGGLSGGTLDRPALQRLLRDIDEGRIDNRRPFFSLQDRKPAIVDGATVDADGYLWFALNLGGKVLRIDPDGRLDREISLPVRSPTCVAFGGKNYETLFVTSQQSFLSDEELARHPRPGSVFAIHGLGVQGVPEPRFGRG